MNNCDEPKVEHLTGYEMFRHDKDCYNFLKGLIRAIKDFRESFSHYAHAKKSLRITEPLEEKDDRSEVQKAIDKGVFGLDFEFRYITERLEDLANVHLSQYLLDKATENEDGLLLANQKVYKMMGDIALNGKIYKLVKEFKPNEEP